MVSGLQLSGVCLEKYFGFGRRSVSTYPDPVSWSGVVRSSDSATISKAGDIDLVPGS